MTLKGLSTWNRRVSALYAAGIWTMICSYGVFMYTGRSVAAPVKKEEVQEPENPNRVIYETSWCKGEIVYREGFVPYTTRIFNFIKSFSREPGSGASDK